MSPRMQGEVSPQRASRLLGVNPQTVWRWCRESRIEARLDATGHYYIRESAVEAIMANPTEWRRRAKAC